MDRKTRRDFSDICTRADVAELLDTSDSQLRYLLYGRRESRRYRTFSIPKRAGGSRTIESPRHDLMLLQRKLLELLVQIYRPPKGAHGYVHGRSIVSGASKHRAKRFVFNVDLQDFFATINFGRVLRLFQAAPMSAKGEGSVVLAQICCHRGALPQGAPTSPILSNMICRRLDRQLAELARAHDCVYTRYADDITFSKKRGGFPPAIGYIDETGTSHVGEELRKIIVEGNGFAVNGRKVSLRVKPDRQTVTGLTVNTKCNVKRQFVRQIRAMIHAWEKYGSDAAGKVHGASYYRRRGKRGEVPPFERVVRGKLDYVKMVKGVGDPVYRNLQTQLVRVCPEYEQVMWEENQQMDARDVFISYASEDKADIAKPLAEGLVRSGVSVWFDEFEIQIGDDLTEKINDGLSKAKFGVVILSSHFFSKKKTWPKREVSGLIAKEDADGQKRILPVWHKLDQDDVAKRSPVLAGLFAIKTQDHTIGEIVEAVKRKVLQRQAAPTKIP